MGLHLVGVLEVGLVGVGVLGIHHPFPALLLVALLRALLLDELQILHQTLHLLLTRLLVALDMVDHRVDALLGLLELAGLSAFHVLLDGLCGLHSQVVFNHVHVFVYLSDLLVGVDEGQGKRTGACHLLSLHALGAENGLADHVLPNDIANLALHLGDGKLEDEILGNL